MKAEAGPDVWESPGRAPQGAVDFLHGLMAEDTDRLAVFVQSQPDATWAAWLEAQGLAPLTFYLLRAVGLAQGVRDISDALRSSYYTATANHTLLSETLRELLAELGPLGIQPIVLKGMALSSTLYPTPATRPTSDLDLLVQRSHVTAVEQVLLGQGFHDLMGLGAGERLANTNHLQVRRSFGDGQSLSVEVHWRLLNNPGYVRYVDADQLRARAQPANLDGCAALVLEPCDQLLHACAHLLLHHSQNPRLIWLLDLRMLVLRHGQEWNWIDLVDRARVMHLAASLRYWLTQAEGWFGTFLPEQARQALAFVQPAEDEARFIAAAQAGNQQLWEHHWLGMRGVTGWRQQLAYLKEIFFPPWAFMQHRYSARSRWLAPLYYGWRFIRAGLTAFQRSG